jgi:hypothetical protein
VTPDQIARLKDLADGLVEVFLEEADPEAWPGAGQGPGTWTKEMRGDRVWHKKGAQATAGVLRHALELIARGAPEQGAAPAEPDEDAEIERFEREAQKHVERALARARESAGDRGAGS